jgi:hypothetical protein
MPSFSMNTASLAIRRPRNAASDQATDSLRMPKGMKRADPDSIAPYRPSANRQTLKNA